MRKLVLLVFVLGCAGPGHGSNSPDGSPGPGDGLAGDGTNSTSDGNNCAMEPCSLFPQCGCSAIEACDLNDTSTGNACRGASGGMDGTGCVAPTACAAGYTCGYYGNTGSCMKFCAADTDCVGPRSLCTNLLADGTGNPIPGVKLCSSNCDPMAASDGLCPATWSCDVYSTTDPRYYADCRPTGSGTQGAACSESALCAAGLTCVSLGSAMQCAKICSPPSNDGCPAATTCSAYSPPLVIAGVQYGVCL